VAAEPGLEPGMPDPEKAIFLFLESPQPSIFLFFVLKYLIFDRQIRALMVFFFPKNFQYLDPKNASNPQTMDSRYPFQP
jgi:hypothetical protein